MATAAVESRQAIKLGPRALDLTGQQFGALTALRPTGRRGRSVLWECECVCGKRTHRSTEALRRSLAIGTAPACHSCRQKRRGWSEGQRLKLTRAKGFYQHHLRELWTQDGTLYSDGVLAAMERDIAEDLWRATLIVPDDPDVQELKRQIAQVGSVEPGLGWSPHEPEPLPDGWIDERKRAEAKPDPLVGAQERHQSWLEQIEDPKRRWRKRSEFPCLMPAPRPAVELIVASTGIGVASTIKTIGYFDSAHATTTVDPAPPWRKGQRVVATVEITRTHMLERFTLTNLSLGLLVLADARVGPECPLLPLARDEPYFRLLEAIKVEAGQRVSVGVRLLRDLERISFVSNGYCRALKYSA